MTVNGIVDAVGSPITVSGILPGGNTVTTRTFYATQFDNQNQIQFNDSQNGPYTRANTRLILSNTQLPDATARFTADNNGMLGDYTAMAAVGSTTTYGAVTIRGQVDAASGQTVRLYASATQRPETFIGTTTTQMLPGGATGTSYFSYSATLPAGTGYTFSADVLGATGTQGTAGDSVANTAGGTSTAASVTA